MNPSGNDRRAFGAAALPTAPLAPTADQIADAFDLLTVTYRWFRAELDEISACETPLSQTCVDRLVALGERMQPAAAARSLLAAVAPDRVLAGVTVWVSRNTPNGADYKPAALRARRLWAAGGEQ